MRLSTTSRQLIRQAITEFVGEQASVKLFGSRLDAQQKGGDIDLLVTVLHPVENPVILEHSKKSGQLCQGITSGGR